MITLQVCFLYFCRVQELLNCRVSDVVNPDRLIIHGLKKSSSYCIFLPFLSSQIFSCPSICQTDFIFPISYSKLYRDCVKVGIGGRISGSVNSRRLHWSRYLFSQLSSTAVVDNELAGILRHRSYSSYNNYLKRKESPYGSDT